jgi:hypothetical protein
VQREGIELQDLAMPPRFFAVKQRQDDEFAVDRTSLPVNSIGQFGATAST